MHRYRAGGCLSYGSPRLARLAVLGAAGGIVRSYRIVRTRGLGVCCSERSDGARDGFEPGLPIARLMIHVTKPYIYIIKLHVTKAHATYYQYL